MVELRFPTDVKRNPGYWLNAKNAWVSRRKFLRRDNSNAWRASFTGVNLARHPLRSVPFSEVLGGADRLSRFRIVIIGDSGEGDQSQYGLVPLIRALDPQWMILNGDVAYPAGRESDFELGFFRPYRRMRFPIWAVPGNHEYYSHDKGRTFFQTFCTYRYAREWSDHEIPFVPQPGTYWEVKEPGMAAPRLTVIGLDTGMKGNLDGKGWGKREDSAQLAWLRARLARAEAENRVAIVVFHIPALVDERHKKKVHLAQLHRILAASAAVRLVICGHIHNHQYYRPDTFDAYLKAAQGTAAIDPPHYIVTGGGGAYLSAPRNGGDYPADFFFPTRGQWQQHARAAEKFVARTGLARAAIGRIASIVSASHRADEDSAKYMSLVIVDVADDRIEARHVLMPNLAALYPTATVVDIENALPAIAASELDTLLSDDPAIGKIVIPLSR